LLELKTSTVPKWPSNSIVLNQLEILWQAKTWKLLAKHDPQHHDRAWRILKRIIGKYCTIKVCKSLGDLTKKTLCCNGCQRWL
jgi:hypothetical protein